MTTHQPEVPQLGVAGDLVDSDIKNLLNGLPTNFIEFAENYEQIALDASSAQSELDSIVDMNSSQSIMEDAHFTQDFIMFYEQSVNHPFVQEFIRRQKLKDDVRLLDIANDTLARNFGSTMILHKLTMILKPGIYDIGANRYLIESYAPQTTKNNRINVYCLTSGQEFPVVFDNQAQSDSTYEPILSATPQNIANLVRDIKVGLFSEHET